MVAFPKGHLWSKATAGLGYGVEKDLQALLRVIVKADSSLCYSYLSAFILKGE